MLVIKTLDDAEKFVQSQQRRGNDCYWENYDINFFKPNEQALTSKHGILRNGRWGYKNMSPLGEDGTWSIDERNIRRPRRNRD